MAQPAMPPNRLAAMLGTPMPLHSRFLELGVSVSSSTTLAVIMDSSNPTMAIASAGRAIRRSVSSDQGTCGSPKLGRPSGSRPRSATVFRGRSSQCAATVSTTMQTRGEGTAVVSRGRP